MSCPICEQALKGHAELTAGDVVTHVYDCPVCGRYAASPEVRTLLATMSDAVRWNVMARLEVRALPAAADGTVVLEPAHFKPPR